MVLIFEALLKKIIRIEQWVTIGVEFDHNPMLLEVVSAIEKLASSFKLNPKWMKVEDLVGKM